MSCTKPTARALSIIILQRITDLQRELQEKSRIPGWASPDLVAKAPDILANPPLKRIRHPTNMLYVSAIAHRIATQYGVAATEIATEIAQTLNPKNAAESPAEPDNLSATLWQGITVQVTASQDLLFQIHDRAIATWLNHLIHNPLPPPLSLSPPSSSLANPFPLQHAHARCCSLLHLANRMGLITLQPSESATWQWLHPHPIPWLTPTEQLYPNHGAERRLISQLWTVLDQWSERSPTSKIAIQQAEQLTQGFHNAHRAYPIWGDRSPEASDRQAAHLGLLLITQRVLQRLLASLEIPSPTEL